MDPAAIVTYQLFKEYSGKKAVEDLSFNVPYGKIVGLLGPNGAGKTTTMRMLVGFVEPDRGWVEIDGKRHGTEKNAIKAQVGFLTGEMSLYPNLTPRQNLSYLASLRGMSSEVTKRRIMSLIEQFNMERYCDTKFHKLSTGERQRAIISATLLHDPKILILDELTASLDVISSAFIIEFLKQERARGKALLFSTHILSEAEYLCDHILVIHQGRLIAEGTMESLKHRYNAVTLTEAFFGAVKESTNGVHHASI